MPEFLLNQWSSVPFFTEYTNLALIAIAIISGGMLFAPSLSPRRRGQTIAEVTELINRRNALVLDVRSAQEYATGHLPQARHAELASLPERANLIAKNKANPIVLVCQTGQRAAKAEAILKQAGYSEVFCLQGGLDGWKQAGLPLVKQGANK